MSATVEPLPDDTFRVACTDHGLDRVVYTEAHARNLAALHDRMDHDGITAEAMQAALDNPVEPLQRTAVLLRFGPDDTLDLTAAAQLVVVAAEVGGTVAATTLALWSALTRRPSTEALDYARELVLSETPTTAAIVPF